VRLHDDAAGEVPQSERHPRRVLAPGEAQYIGHLYSCVNEIRDRSYTGIVDRHLTDQSSAEALYGLLSTILRHVPRDLSLTSVATLSTLDRTGPRRITDLALSEGVAQPSMTALVTNLEREGLVERRRDPYDGRVALVDLTEAGRAYLAARRHAGARSLSSLIGKLPDADAVALSHATQALRHLRDLDERQRDPIRPEAIRQQQ
jgi:DNA-binding MarR family transcriptional regulator